MMYQARLGTVDETFFTLKSRPDPVPAKSPTVVSLGPVTSVIQNDGEHYDYQTYCVCGSLELPVHDRAGRHLSGRNQNSPDDWLSWCRRWGNPFNPDGTFSDGNLSVSFDLTKDGEQPRLEQSGQQSAVVRAYTDLKRHNLCDAQEVSDPIRFFCNENFDQGRPEQDGRPGAEFFITRKLWDVGSSAPYGHRGDLTTIAEAILMHGGEARKSRDAFVSLPQDNQVAIVRFLKTLQVLPDWAPVEPAQIADSQ